MVPTSWTIARADDAPKEHKGTDLKKEKKSKKSKKSEKKDSGDMGGMDMDKK